MLQVCSYNGRAWIQLAYWKFWTVCQSKNSQYSTNRNWRPPNTEPRGWNNQSLSCKHPQSKLRENKTLSSLLNDKFWREFMFSNLITWVIMLVEVRFTQILWPILLDIISCFLESNLFWCCKCRNLPLAYHNLPVVLFPLYVVVPHIVTINILGDMHFGTLSVAAPKIFSRVFKKMQKLYKLYNNNKKK